MKNIFFVLAICVTFSFPLFAQQNIEDYYYYQREKIILQQSKNQIFLKFTPDANKEQVLTLINSYHNLQPTVETNMNDNILNFVILEAKNENEISLSETIETLKANPIVVFATPLFLYRKSWQGLTDEFVVKLKPSTSYKDLQKFAEQNNCLIKKEDIFVKNQFMMDVSKNAKLNAIGMSRLFFETGLFEFSEPNFIVFNAYNSNDTYFNQQWGLKNTGQHDGTNGVDIKAEQAWTIATGTNIKVAVVDQGVDLTHPDLQANLLPGYDASGSNSAGAPVYYRDDHGTPCAGIIGAIKDNGIGISGVAPDCKIIPIKNSDNNGLLYTSVAATAINWAWRNGADVINNSWSWDGPPYQQVTNAINAAVSQGRNGKGCVVVFSTGIYDVPTVNQPASLPNVIAVGAVSQCGERKSSFSCDADIGWGSPYDETLDIVAPGVLIPTTDRQGSDGYADGDYDEGFYGTSAAAPHVSGVAALILSVNPDLTSKQVQDIIEQTAQKVGNYNYTDSIAHPNGTWHEEMGYGLVDAYEAVRRATCTTCPYVSLFGTQPPPAQQPYKHVICEEINIQNATVPTGSTLILDACDRVTINAGFKVEAGARFIVK